MVLQQNKVIKRGLDICVRSSYFCQKSVESLSFGIFLGQKSLPVFILKNRFLPTFFRQNAKIVVRKIEKNGKKPVSACFLPVFCLFFKTKIGSRKPSIHAGFSVFCLFSYFFLLINVKKKINKYIDMTRKNRFLGRTAFFDDFHKFLDVFKFSQKNIALLWRERIKRALSLLFLCFVFWEGDKHEERK